ncbi:predicted protein [Naegleria gruberi]|uniref:Predicted protein n=1 Tax=Naegleria gruberi TaxID=5762 RepID=D2VEM2_NAEGR|nr:uncharacterized protein NAEGRDRAFT_67325 [Naegleria gruberi]EFC44910.1 predicted protein [Naegleria gruberi]|eukprot:XP_002677654.1 predicted protein [Naegleria gruberi strain NEG-M]
MKVESKESPFENGIRCVLQDLDKIFINVQDQEAAKSIQERLKVMTEKYKKNILFELLQKKLFYMGVYHHQEVSVNLFNLKKSNIEKMVTNFRKNGVEGVITNLISQLYIKLEENTFGNLIRKVIGFLGTTIYDGNEQAIIIKIIREKVHLEIFEDEEEDYVEFKRVVQRKKLEKSMIIFDDSQKEIYWTKESFEEFVQQVKKYQQHECLALSVELIGKIREKQTNLIIDVNSIYQEDLEAIPLNVRRKIEKMQSEIGSARSLFSQGFNTNLFHFILEFIQNADDSEYLQGGILEFDFDESRKVLKIKSNECGFTYDNLYSLSGIADSDKVSKKLETLAIGEKGIGFKTIFSVCKKVHLVSNGFDVFLTSTDLTKKENQEFNLSDGTLYEIEIEKFDHSIFDKYTLLTLKNIKTIIFKDGLNTTKYSLTCKDNEYLLSTTFKSKTTTEKFYGFSIENGINMKNILCEKRPNFHRADLMVFFPEEWKVDKRYKLHSFLPVKEDYNLPLLIQSDFILSQNREALLESSDWNISIIDHIPQLLVKAFNTMKNINNWKYDFFKVLQVESKLHFSNVQFKTINLLQNIDCIPLLGGQTKYFEKPSNIILMGNSPINPYEAFGIETTFIILNKECIDTKFENEKLMFKQWDKLFTKFEKQHVVNLAKNLPYNLKFDKIVQLYKLFKHFNIGVKSLDFEIVPTRLQKLVKPSENILDCDLSKSSLLLLEKASNHCLDTSLKDYKHLISTTQHIQNLHVLSNEELFVLFHERKTLVSPICLTRDGEWLHPNQCYIHSKHTSYLEKAKFVDLESLVQILYKQKHEIYSTDNISNILIELGTKTVPTLFRQQSYSYNYEETLEFKELRKQYQTLESLIEYFDNNFSLFQNQINGIHNFLNKNIQNLYDPDLRKIFSDTIDYLPYIKNAKLKEGLRAKKEDLQAYQNLIMKTKSVSSIVHGLKSQFSTHIQKLLKTQPLLITTNGEFVVLDNNLFYSMDAKLQKYRPEWKEIHNSYKYGEINSILNTLSTSHYETILLDENPTKSDQQYFIEAIINTRRSSTSTAIVSLSGIYVTANNDKKIPLSKMYWDLSMREVFPIEVNELLLYNYFPNSTIIKNVIQSNDIKTLPDLCQILKTHLNSIVVNDISKLSNKELSQLEVLVSEGFSFSLPSSMIWDLLELKDIPFFRELDLSRRFGKLSNLVKYKDNNKERVVPEEKIREFLLSDNITDDQFLNVWKYCKRTCYKQKMLKFIYDNGLIVCHNRKHKKTELFKILSPELMVDFPALNLLQVDNKYNDFDISQEIPFHIICKEIEKLEKDTDNADNKCLVLYKEINRQIKNDRLDRAFCNNYKIFRSDKGIHFSEAIYYCDNEESYKQLQNVVDCLFVRNVTELSHFLQFFKIKPLSDTISYKHPKTTPSTTDCDNILKKFKVMVQNINKYLSRQGFTPKEMDLQIVQSLSVTAIIGNGNSCEISRDIHSDIENEVIYVMETNFEKAIFQDKRFIDSFLLFYPQLAEHLHHVLKLLIVSHGTTQDDTIDVVMSLILS